MKTLEQGPKGIKNILNGLKVKTGVVIEGARKQVLFDQSKVEIATQYDRLVNQALHAGRAYEQAYYPLPSRQREMVTRDQLLDHVANNPKNSPALRDAAAKIKAITQDEVDSQIQIETIRRFIHDPILNSVNQTIRQTSRGKSEDNPVLDRISQKAAQLTKRFIYPKNLIGQRHMDVDRLEIAEKATEVAGTLYTRVVGPKEK